jgi:hypothetical protein
MLLALDHLGEVLVGQEHRAHVLLELVLGNARAIARQRTLRQGKRDLRFDLAVLADDHDHQRATDQRG